MASRSGASSSASTRARGGRDPNPTCPFCKTRTVVERMSMTDNNPLKKYYTCTNRDWDNDRCAFFMWKPVSSEDPMEAAALRIGTATKDVKEALKKMKESVDNMVDAIAAQGVQLRAHAVSDRDKRWFMLVSVILGLVNLVLLGIVMSQM